MTPLDVVKTRLQAQLKPIPKSNYDTLLYLLCLHMVRGQVCLLMSKRLMMGMYHFALGHNGNVDQQLTIYFMSIVRCLLVSKEIKLLKFQ